MQIALRSQLIAGTAAVVGASAIAMTPVTAAVNLPTIKMPSVAQVALAGFDNPLSELLLTLGVVNADIFDGNNVYDSYEWEPYVGILPEFIYTALPIISQLGFNGSAYIGGSIDAVGTSAYILSEAVWNFPGAVFTAAQQAIGGDIAGAITTLTNATLVPIQAAASTLVGAGISVVSGVITNLTNLVLTVPGIVAGLVNTTIGSVTALGNAVVTIATQTLGSLATLNFEAAWNVVVDGLLGPVGADGNVTSSIPGVLEAATIGPGIGPLGFPNGYAVPSLRMWAEQSQLQVANALGATYPVPAAAEAAPAAAKAVRAEAPVAAPSAGDESGSVDVDRPVAGDESGSAAGSAGNESTGATESGSESAGSTTASSGSSESAEKPSKSRAVRKGAKAASAAAS